MLYARRPADSAFTNGYCKAELLLAFEGVSILITGALIFWVVVERFRKRRIRYVERADMVARAAEHASERGVNLMARVMPGR